MREPFEQATRRASAWRSVLWPFLVLAGPMVASRLGLAGMGLADGWMIARLSQDGSAQLAVWSLVDGTLGRALDIAVAFILPGLALVAQARAQGKPHIAAAVWRRALRLSWGPGRASTAVMPAMPWLMHLSPGAQAMSAQASAIANALAWGFVAALLAMASAGYLEAMGRPLVPVLMVLLANLANVGLNALLIGGSLWPAVSGAEGCAWASTAVRWMMALVLTALAWRSARRHPGSDHGLTRRVQLSRGASAAAQSTLTQVLGLATPLLLAGLGRGLWAHWSALWLLLLPLGILAWGLADACSLRVAAMTTQHSGPALRRRILILLACSGVLLSLSSLPWWWWPQALEPLLNPQHPVPPETLRVWVALTTLAMAVDGLSAVVAASLRSLHVLGSTLAVQSLCSAAQVLGLWAWSQSPTAELASALWVVVGTAGLKWLGLTLLLWRHAPQPHPLP